MCPHFFMHHVVSSCEGFFGTFHCPLFCSSLQLLIVTNSTSSIVIITFKLALHIHGPSVALALASSSRILSLTDCFASFDRVGLRSSSFGCVLLRWAPLSNWWTRGIEKYSLFAAQDTRGMADEELTGGVGSKRGRLVEDVVTGGVVSTFDGGITSME